MKLKTDLHAISVALGCRSARRRRERSKPRATPWVAQRQQLIPSLKGWDKPRLPGAVVSTFQAEKTMSGTYTQGVALGLDLSVLRTENAPSCSRRNRRGGQQAA